MIVYFFTAPADMLNEFIHHELDNWISKLARSIPNQSLVYVTRLYELVEDTVLSFSSSFSSYCFHILFLPFILSQISLY